MALETDRVLVDLLGLTTTPTRVLVGHAPSWHSIEPASYVPVDSELLDRVLRPDDQSDDPDNLLLQSIVFLTPPLQAAYVAVFGEAFEYVSVDPYRNNVSAVLAVAIAIAAARIAGDGIGDAHQLLGDRPPADVASPMDQEAVLAYLREPAARHREIEPAADAILAKTAGLSYRR
ncbi:MAG: hypothetical protein H0U52_05280 [Chloroflexi bacterium]|nr:hypothetical protein [Chloroflexota bacterium]